MGARTTLEKKRQTEQQRAEFLRLLKEANARIMAKIKARMQQMLKDPVEMAKIGKDVQKAMQ